MTPDGKIYGLPQVNAGAELRVSRKLFINKKWLEKVNMDVPTTTEEFYQVLKAFYEQDANNNGIIDDEVPLSSQDWISIKEAFLGAFGLGNRGSHNFDVDFDPTTKNTRLIATSDGYKDFLEYFNRLYSENLIDKNLFENTTNQKTNWYNKACNDEIGVFSHTNLASLPIDKLENWIAIDEALEGPNGDKLWSPIRACFHSTGAAVIPTSCKNPELVLRWLDYFWTDEGTLFYHLGIENDTFVVNPDGTYDYSKKIYDEITSSNTSFDNVVAKYSPYPGGGNPTVEIAPYFMGGEMAEIPANAAKKLFAYGPSEYWPSFTFTTEENNILNPIKKSISSYCDEMTIKFINGSELLTYWDDYKNHIDELNVSKMLEIYQAAVSRYNNLNIRNKNN